MERVNHHQLSDDAKLRIRNRLIKEIQNQEGICDALDFTLLRDSINDEVRRNCTLSRIRAGQKVKRLKDKLEQI